MGPVSFSPDHPRIYESSPGARDGKHRINGVVVATGVENKHDESNSRGSSVADGADGSRSGRIRDAGWKAKGLHAGGRVPKRPETAKGLGGRREEGRDVTQLEIGQHDGR